MNAGPDNQQDFYAWTQQQAELLRSRQFNKKEQRRRIIKRLQQSTSLKNKLDEIINDAYELARGDAADETGLPESDFPETCPWTYTQIVDMEFWPGE
jgi:hypothetical protein